MLREDVEAVHRLPGRLEAIEAHWPDWSSGGLIVALAAVVSDPSRGRYDSHTIESLEVVDYEAVLEQKYLGYDVNWPDKEDWRPLDMAAGCAPFSSIERAHRMAEWLLAHGAEMTPRGAVMLGRADWLRARHPEGTLANPSVMKRDCS